MKTEQQIREALSRFLERRSKVTKSEYEELCRVLDAKVNLIEWILGEHNEQ